MLTYVLRDIMSSQKEYRANRRMEVRQWIDEYKSGLSCACGQNHPATLDFHHIDPTQKDFSIKAAVARRYSLERVKKEIAKCIVLCANCHRVHHWEERNNNKLK